MAKTEKNFLSFDAMTVRFFKECWIPRFLKLCFKSSDVVIFDGKILMKRHIPFLLLWNIWSQYLKDLVTEISDQRN